MHVSVSMCAFSSYWNKSVALVPHVDTNKTKIGFNEAWKQHQDKEKIRVAIRDKKPFKNNWPTIKEKDSISELLTKYGEYGERTGRKYKNGFYYIGDFDFYKPNRDIKVSEHLKKSFIKITQLLRVKWWETSSGNAHLPIFLKEPIEKSRYFMTLTDQFGKPHHMGELLGKGCQARASHRTEKGEGKWQWKAQNLEALNKLLNKFFINIGDKVKVARKHAEKSAPSIKVSNEQKIQQIIGDFLIKQATIGKRKRLSDTVYKIWYKNKDGSPKHFLLNTKYQSRYDENIIDRLPEGAIRTFILSQAKKHKFFKQLIE